MPNSDGSYSDDELATLYGGVQNPPLQIPESKTGDPNTDFAIPSRQVDLTQIPEYSIMKQIIPNWMGVRPSLVGQGPDTKGYTYGDTDTRLNIPGVFNTKTGNLGIQSQSLLEAQKGNPDDVSILAHELTHFYQNRGLPNYPGSGGRSTVASTPGIFSGDPDSIILKGEYSAEKNTISSMPTILQQGLTQPNSYGEKSAYTKNSPLPEKEAVTIQQLYKTLMQVRLQEALRNKYAPGLATH